MVYLVCESLQKARVDHLCDDCATPIHKGCLYTRQALRYDDFYTWKSHVDCRAAAIALQYCHGQWNDEGTCLQRDVSSYEDAQWLRDHYPAAAARIGLVEGFSP